MKAERGTKGAEQQNELEQKRTPTRREQAKETKIFSFPVRQ
jgi:hypothetical protein